MDSDTRLEILKEAEDEENDYWFITGNREDQLPSLPNEIYITLYE